MTFVQIWCPLFHFTSESHFHHLQEGAGVKVAVMSIASNMWHSVASPVPYKLFSLCVVESEQQYRSVLMFCCYYMSFKQKIRLSKFCSLCSPIPVWIFQRSLTIKKYNQQTQNAISRIYNEMKDTEIHCTNSSTRFGAIYHTEWR